MNATTDPHDVRAEARLRIDRRAAAYGPALAKLDAGLEQAAKALTVATEAERQARQALVATQKARRGFLHAHSMGNAEDIAALKASADPAVIAALADARQQVDIARHGDSAAKLGAYEQCASELEALLLVDGDMSSRIAEVLAHVSPRIMWRSAIGELLAARPPVASDGGLTPAAEATERVLSELRKIDPLARGAEKRITEIMSKARRPLAVLS